MGKFIFCQRVTTQIGDNEFDTCTDTIVLDEDEPLFKLKEWMGRPAFNVMAVGHVECRYDNE